MANHQKCYAASRFTHPLLIALLCCCLSSGSIWAEVTLDGTLGRSGAVSGPNYQITADLGQQFGINLFHSFGKFNVNTGESAIFAGPDVISNIISRVTGGASSWIDGRLRSEITGANLYLLNPAGVMFGPNASLDISGSFHVSTADYLKLSQDGFFYATTPEKSVLTSAPPSAFGFLGSNPGNIGFDRTVLEVPSGKTISVIGGDILVQNSSLATQGGRINLASAASSGEVRLGDAGIVMEGFAREGNITVTRDTDFTNYLDVDVGAWATGQDGGAVYIRGGRFELQGGSIFASTGSDNPGGGVDIKVTDNVVMDSQGIKYGGAIISETWGGSGRAGDVLIESKRLELIGGGYIETSTWGNGRGGNINISAGESVLFSGARGLDYSGLYAKTYLSGEGGHIYLSTPNMTITEKGKVSAKSLGSGNAGNISLSVGSLSLSSGGSVSTDALDAGRGGQVHIIASGPVVISGEKDSFSSQISSSAEYTGAGGSIFISTPALSLDNGGTIVSQNGGQGNGGNITLDVATLAIKGGSNINSGTFGEGNCGHINISASESVTISGKVGDVSSAVYATSFWFGRGGNIFIVSKGLEMDDGAYMSTGTMGYGDAGNVRFDVGSLTMNGGSQVTTDAMSLGTGRGGNIAVNASGSVSISGQKYGNQTGLYTNTSSQGDAGNITMVSPSCFMDQDGVLSSKTGSRANAGAIRLDVGNLSVNGGASIGTESIFGGQGGDITVTASQSVDISGESLSAPSGLFASTLYGDRGGNINIFAPYLLVTRGGQIQSRAEGGDAGQVRINVNNLSLAGGGAISVSTGLLVGGSGQGGDIIVTATGSVAISETGSGLYSNSYGSGDAGNIKLSSPILAIRDNGFVAAYAEKDGNAGNIGLTIDKLTVDGGSQITADTFGGGHGGNIDIVTTGPVTLIGPDKGTYHTGIFTSAHGDGDGGNIFLKASSLTVNDLGLIQAGTEGNGNSGNIKIQIGTLALMNGGQISAATYGKGQGGIIDISATDSIAITGTMNNYNSCLAVQSLYGGGKGGNISVFAPIITLSEGGWITGTTRGDGDAGSIRLDVGSLNLANDAIIYSRTYGSGQGGQIDISAKDNVTVNGSEISTSSSGSGNGGTILLHMASLQMKNNASISAESSDTGKGGDIAIHAADSIYLSNNSTITTETLKSDGGNIEVWAPQSAYLSSSGITTSVQGGLGNGGNISIDPRFVILNNSSMIANAYGGNGGNISIVSDYFLASMDSTVQASSQLGISGTINITAPDVDLSGSLTVLPANYLDAASLLRDRCAALSDEKTSSLVVVGRGGMPIEPDDYLPSP